MFNQEEIILGNKILSNLHKDRTLSIGWRGFLMYKRKDTDEVFIVIDGEMSIAFRDGHVKLSKGEMYVIPKGVEHKPYAEKECHIMLVEPKDVVNTGETNSKITAENNIWI